MGQHHSHLLSALRYLEDGHFTYSHLHSPMYYVMCMIFAPTTARACGTLAIAQAPSGPPFNLGGLPREVVCKIIQHLDRRQLKRLRRSCRWLKILTEPKIFGISRIRMERPFSDCGAMAISLHPTLKYYLKSLAVEVHTLFPWLDRDLPNGFTHWDKDKENWEWTMIARHESRRTFTRERFLQSLRSYFKTWREIRNGTRRTPNGYLVLKQIVSRCPRISSVTLYH